MSPEAPPGPRDSDGRPQGAAGHPPPDYPSPGYPPPGYPSPDYPPPGPAAYPPPGYPPQGYPPPGTPGYPPPNAPGCPPPGYPQGPGSYPPPGTPGYPPPGYPPPGGNGGAPRQHAWHTPNGRPPAENGPPPPRPNNQRTLVWVIVAVALGAILVRAHRITSNDVIFFCVLIPSVILHEIAHGAVALVFGDDTAKRAGRLSLNPLRHVTLFGTIIVPFITIVSGLGFFGWAKPVPVNVRRLRSPRNHGFLVSLAGPLTNVVLAAVLGGIFYVAFAAGQPYVVATLPARIFFWGSVINVWVACFNLIPIPPLDGSALLERLLPASWWPGYLRIRPYGMVVIFGLLVLFSITGSSPIATVFNDIATWWGHVIHAF